MNSPLIDIGAELRQARESQQRSLDELSHLTLIHNRHLQAVEEGRDADLPEPFYVKNFIRKYANALGLPGDAMANRYWDTRPLPPQPPKPASSPDLMVPWWVFPAMLGALLLGAIATFAVMNSNRAPAVAESPVARTAGQHAATAGSSGSVFAPAGGADSFGATGDVAAAGSAQGATGSAPDGAGSGVPGVESSGGLVTAASGAPVVGGSADPGPAALASAPTPPVPSPGPTSSPAPLNMPPLVVPDREISFKTWNKEAAWMQIVADGREVHSGVMPRNMVRTWTARRSLAVRIGRPGVVSARLGERSLGLLGDKDAPVYRQTFFTREGAADQEAAGAAGQTGQPAVEPEGRAAVEPAGQAPRHAAGQAPRQNPGRAAAQNPDHVARSGNQPAARRAASPKPRPTPRPTAVPATPAPEVTPRTDSAATPSPEGGSRTITVE